jgi:hypothetical protein
MSKFEEVLSSPPRTPLLDSNHVVSKVGVFSTPISTSPSHYIRDMFPILKSPPYSKISSTNTKRGKKEKYNFSLIPSIQLTINTHLVNLFTVLHIVSRLLLESFHFLFPNLHISFVLFSQIVSFQADLIAT